MAWNGPLPRDSRHLTAAVAAMLQAHGRQVSVETDVDGVQLDILALRETDDGLVRTAVECKAFTKLVGLRSVHSWGSTVEYLRSQGKIDEGVLVTTSGFTSNAQRAARSYDLQLSTFDDLARAAPDQPDLVSQFFLRWVRVLDRETGGGAGKKRIFVVMPFEASMLDVYLLGVRWVASQLGLVVNRADDLEHNGEIIEEVQDALRKYDAVVADTTGANANVCYEVGYAHAAKTPTILICRRGEKIPFDLQGVNHIIYPNIVELRPKLHARLRATLNI